MPVLLYSFVLLIGSCLVGLTAAVRHWNIEQHTHPSADGCLAGCAAGLRFVVLGVLFGLVALFALFALMSRGSYADYFALGLLGYALVIVWFPAVASGAVLADIHVSFGNRPTTRRGLYALMLGCWLFFGWLGATTPATLAQSAMMLISGPQHDHGLVMQTATSGGRSPRYYVTIDEVPYEVPDHGWFETLCPGDQVDFVHDPANTSAFAPDKVGLTSLGVLASICGTVLWAVTLGCTVQGLCVIGRGLYRYWRQLSDQVTAL